LTAPTLLTAADRLHWNEKPHIGFGGERFLSPNDHVDLRTQLVVHATGGLLVLLVLFAATLLSVYKPWGLTPYELAARREQRESSLTGSSSLPEPILETRPPASPQFNASVGLYRRFHRLHWSC
jgi:hypothetical protein